MYFDNIAFKYEFRDYQQRVLDTLHEKMDDNKLHIVAAPGSGKTVLGLEIIRRADCPCLILVPSISIREQWVDRFLELFVSDAEKAYWEKHISTEIDHPGILTCVTYQALYALFNDERYSHVMEEFVKAGYRAICLDESHHLKKEWWKAIEKTVQLLEEPLVISLTATPPYDSDNAEWAKYNALCGDIDCEVLTPEMVKKHTLCPYQDHVYLSVPTEEEIITLNKHMASLEQDIKEILISESLYKLMKDYDALINPHARAELYIDEPRLLQAFVSYIKYYGVESVVFYEKEKEKIDAVLSRWDRQLMSLSKEEQVKALDGHLLELFLDTIVHKDSEHMDEEILESFCLLLEEKKVLIKNKISIIQKHEEIEKLTRNSISKMESIKTIVRHEAKSLGDKLQMVILVDNIGKEELSRIETEEAFTKINCVSVFETLRRMEHLNNLDAYMNSYIDYVRELAGMRMGLLCGTFAILPTAAGEYLQKEGKQLGNTGYFSIDIGDSERREIVALVTKLLEERVINILVGTVSLLGEGWDAPGVNTVVIGSTISSFVQTNQMRGRGLRLDQTYPEKTANIWHLATLRYDEKRDCFVGGEEYRNLVKRFDTILGISSDGQYISSGIERIGLLGTAGDMLHFSKADLNRYTEQVLHYSENRSQVMQQWNRLISYQSDFSHVRDVVTTKRAGLFRFRQKDRRFSTGELKRIANGLHADMVKNGMLSKASVVRMQTSIQSSRVGVCLENCSPKDGKLFTKYFEQVIGKIGTPRYILSKGFGPFKQYMNMPDYCKKKADAESIKDLFGFRNAEIIYTRNDEGIRFLFDLRIKDMTVDRGTIEKVRQVVISG